jgi:hypothetical protein
MKKELIGIIICVLIIGPIASVSASSDPAAILDIQIYGGLPLPYLMQSAGGVLVNLGDVTAYDISYTLKIVGGTSGEINISYEGYYEELEPVTSGGDALGIVTLEANGFGPVLITLTASASNADSLTVNAKGYQIGSFTWVPLSWIIPPVLKDLIPWLDY